MVNFVNEVANVENEMKDQKWFLYARAKELEEQLKLITIHVNKDRLLESKLGQMADLYGKQIGLTMDCYGNLVFYLKGKMDKLQEIFGIFESFHKKNLEKKNERRSQDFGKLMEKVDINEFTQQKVISRKRSELNKFIINIKKMITKFECLKRLVNDFKIPEIIEDYKNKKSVYEAIGKYVKSKN